MFNTAPSFTRCADGYVEYNNKCWRFSDGDDKRTWYDARFACGAENADLVTINSQEEDDFVFVTGNGKKQD